MSMPNGKAPGPDGFTIDFFKFCWPILKNNVHALVQESKTQKLVLKALNATFLTLIPKGDSADSPDKFSPIALCNVVYKIISKVLANRLKFFLPLLISHHQSGYVEGRQIMDCIILSHELIHSLNLRKKLGMMIKLYMSKAFDKISWAYMRAVLEAYEFHKESIKWIMAMVSGAFFSILLNGSPSQRFHPSRGIRQGNPISPFLFVIMAKWLSQSITATLSANELSGLKPHPLAPPSTHQQFVDDTLLMGLPTAKEASSFKTILSDLSAASGTSINQETSKLFFFNTPLPIRRNIARILDFPISTLPSKYLRVPLTNRPLAHVTWEALINKLEKTLAN